MAEFKQQYSQQFGFGADELEQDYNKVQGIVDGVELRNAAQQDKNIEQWAKFSTTAAGWVDKWRAEKDAVKNATKTWSDFVNYPPDTQTQERDDRDGEALNQLSQAQYKIASAAQENGESYSKVSKIIEMGGKPSWNRAVVDVKYKMSRYKTEVYGALKDPRKQYTLPNGETFELGQLDKNTQDGKAKWAYALAVERRNFLRRTGLDKYNVKLLAPYAFNLVQSDSAFLEGKEAEISIAKSEEDRDLAFEANFKNGQYDINEYFEAVSRTVDGKNNPLGYKGAHEALQQKLLYLLENDGITETQIENILDTKIKAGPYEGQTLREAFPNVYGTNIGLTGKGKGTFISKLEDSENNLRLRRGRAKAVQKEEDVACIQNPECVKKAAADAEMSEQEYIQQKINSWDSVPRKITNLYNSKYAEAAPADEASRAAEYLNVLWEANELHPDDHADIINRLPAEDREEWYRRANTQWKNKKTPEYKIQLDAALKPAEEAWGVKINEIPGGQLKSVAAELRNLYKQSFLIYVRPIDQGGKGLTAQEAAIKAKEDTLKYWESGDGGKLYNKEKGVTGRFAHTPISQGKISSTKFPSFIGGVKDFVPEAVRVRNEVRDLVFNNGVDEVKESGILGVEYHQFSEDVLKSQEPFGVRIDDETKWVAQQLRMTPTDLINSQRKLYGLEPLSDKLTLNISNKDYNNLLYNPTPNTSTRALASHNKEQFDPTSVPGGWGYTFETVVPGSENMAAALTEAINENWDLVPEDIDDLQNIIEQGGDWNTLYSLLTEQGIDGHQLNKCAFKYGVKDSNGLPVTCVRPTLQIAN